MLTGYFPGISAYESLAQVGIIVVVFNHRGGEPYRELEYYTFRYGNMSTAVICMLPNFYKAAI